MSIKKTFVFCLLFVLFFFKNVSSVFAEETTTSEKIAVSLVIDTSGSMADTDPNNLRKTAAEIFIDLLSSDDYFGVVMFSTDAVEAIPMQLVASMENKANLKATLAPAITASGDTDYLKALQAAEYQLDSFAEQDVRKVIIFLTDGVPDPDPVQRDNPDFMSGYMESIWSTTANIGLKDYPIYTLGFGNSDQSILERIAADSRGEAKFIENPSAIATNFFEVLRTLKNRQPFFNESLDIQGEHAIPFSVDPYTSQVTMVLVNENAGSNVSVISSDGQTAPQNLGVQKNDNYSIITLNQDEKELAGEWQLIVNGTGNVQLFGDKDLFFKSWMVEPQTNMQHPVNEPLTVSVAVLGELSPDMTIEVLVSKNGIPETNNIQLALKDGYYVGTYDEVDQQGAYSLETIVKDGDILVTKSLTNIKVQELPALRTDEYEKGNSTYKLSESKKITGYLEMRENVVSSQQGIEITSFNLVKDYADGRQEIQVLTDNPDEASGDVASGDGIYSAIMPFDQEGEFSASLVVQGVYQGDMFRLEEDLGDYKVVSSGEVVGAIPKADLIGKAGGDISVPIHLESYSGRRETITVEVDPAIGTVQSTPILLESGEILDGVVEVKLSDGMNLDDHNVQLSLAALDPLTAVTTDMKATISVVSGTNLLLINLKDTFQNNQSIIILIAVLMIAFIAIGRLLYFVLVNKKLNNLGYLEYNKKGSIDSMMKFQLPRNSSKITISFGGHDKNAEVSIVETRYKYNLNLDVVKNNNAMKWVEGYKSLSKGYKPFHLLLNAEAPGIFIIDGEVLTHREIFDQDSFETGGYTFVYRTEVKSLKQQEKAKNVLEGKM
ncbi:VWA domain-containing protein [Trichococcus sp. K1Tr]|uniref:VWA domain-containing protein n=1 Tax=Trichococcus sp. K1Tr TaxID=3020847 RepID=UPI00232AAA39|nr:vWA domain-containing protein [Trichococcus sp. K1Tr]MDB6353948.1 VWA domain-containing protein [Trichococcus sp. K1Tr]